MPRDNQLPAKVLKRIGQVRRLGARGFARTAFVLALGPAVYSLTEPARGIGAELLRRKARTRSLDTRLKRLKERVRNEVDGTSAPLLREIDAAADARVASERAPGIPLVLGEFGRFGEVLSTVGPLRGLGCVPSNRFTERAGPTIQLVDIDGRLGARKFYGEDRGRFVQALEAAMDLARTGCTPAVIAVDWDSNAITSALVRGVRLADATPEPSRIEDALLAIHRAGYVLGEIEEDAVMIVSDSGAAVFVDLQNAIPLAGLSRDMSAHLRDVDRARCNQLFGTGLITAAELRNGMLAAATKKGESHGDRGDRAYASIVIRDDIRSGAIWNTDVGTARWNYVLKDHLPIPKGGAVLDLGSNNGFNPLQMLRHGAASVVGVEYSEILISDGEILKKAFEWLDNRTYDFRYIRGSFADLPSLGLGRFDLVTALCSLYYLSDQQMRDIARYVRSLSDVFVLQCNIDSLVYREEPDQYRRASIEFAREILEQAGFTNHEIVAPRGYSRPLVIGRAT